MYIIPPSLFPLFRFFWALKSWGCVEQLPTNRNSFLLIFVFVLLPLFPKLYVMVPYACFSSCCDKMNIFMWRNSNAFCNGENVWVLHLFSCEVVRVKQFTIVKKKNYWFESDYSQRTHSSWANYSCKLVVGMTHNI